jgi:hypothetical protein
MKTKLLGLVAGLSLFGVCHAEAALVQFDITGIASGNLGGTPICCTGGLFTGGTAFTDVAFDIRLVGDNSTVTQLPSTNDFVIDPLVSASVILSGLGTSVFTTTATRLGIDVDTRTIFFSRSTTSNFDLLDFTLSAADAAAFGHTFPAGFAPVTGTVTPFFDFFGQWGFPAVNTSNGELTFTSVDLTFSSSPIGTTPLPAAFPLFATGLGALGLFSLRRKRKGPPALRAA